jgi:hypothetical protein
MNELGRFWVRQLLPKSQNQKKPVLLLQKSLKNALFTSLFAQIKLSKRG